LFVTVCAAADADCQLLAHAFGVCQPEHGRDPITAAVDLSLCGTGAVDRFTIRINYYIWRVWLNQGGGAVPAYYQFRLGVLTLALPSATPYTV
jgi:hypothetical protein